MNEQHRAKPDYLSDREFECLELFIKYGNKTQAGIEAGYSKKTACAQATRLINGKKGKKYLDSRMIQPDNDKIASADEVMEYLTRVMRGQEKDQFNLEVSIQERTRAAQELAKRLIDRNNDIGKDNVQIIVDIPRVNPTDDSIE